MQIRKTLILVISLLAITLSGCCNTIKPEANNKPAIVMVAFGTSVPKARKVYDYIDAKIRHTYPGHNVCWAFTSEFIQRKLARQGIVIKNAQQVIADLKEQGYKSAVFQSLHIAPGQEYEEIKAIDTHGVNVAVGKSLLDNNDDIEKVIDALKKDIKTDSVNVIACHGNGHHPELNKQLLVFADKIESKYQNVFVCSVEGQPGTGKLKNAATLAEIKGSANYIPLMIVAGDHIMNDVVGIEPESWKNIVGAKQNFQAKPLGYNDRVIEIYIEHLNSALNKIEN